MQQSTLVQALFLGVTTAIAFPTFGSTTYPGSVCKLQHFQGNDVFYDFDTFATSIKNTDSVTHSILCPVTRKSDNGTLGLAVMDVSGTSAEWASADCTFRAHSEDGSSRWSHPDPPTFSNHTGGATILWEEWEVPHKAAYAFHCVAVPPGRRVEKVEIDEFGGANHTVDPGSACRLAAPQSTDNSVRFGTGSTTAPAAIGNYASSSRDLVCPLANTNAGNAIQVTVNVNAGQAWASGDCNFGVTSWNGAQQWVYPGTYTPGKFSMAPSLGSFETYAVRCNNFRAGGWLYNIRRVVLP